MKDKQLTGKMFCNCWKCARADWICDHIYCPRKNIIPMITFRIYCKEYWKS